VIRFVSVSCCLQWRSLAAHPRGVRVLVALLALWFPLLAQAATVVVPPSVGAGASQRRNQEERQRLRSELTPPAPSGPVLIGPPGTPGVPSVKEGGPHFVLQKISITSSHFLPRAELDKLAADYLRRPITLADLYRLVARINALYAKRGLITDRAFLPPQHIVHGSVVIKLVEGRVGRIELRGQPYTDRAFILAHLPVQAGQVLDAPTLQSALEYFNRTNSVGLRAKLRPGSSFGLSDVLLNVLEPPRYQLNLLGNNEGDASTGRAQGGFYGVFNGPLRRGDSLSLYFIGSRGANNYNVQYTVPLTTSGLKLSLSASHDHINIIAGPYEALGIQGSGDQQSVTLTQPLLADARGQLSLGLSLAHAQSRTTLGGFELNNTKSWSPGLGLSAQYTPQWQSWSSSVTLTRPVVKEIYGEQMQYWLLNATLDGRVALPYAGWSASLQSAGQYSAVKSLASSQLFQLGGVSSVPGYPSGTAAGVRGYRVELGVHRRLPYGLQGQVFYAQGSAYTPAQPRLTLESAGVGISGSLPGRGYVGRSAWRFKVARSLRDVIPHQSAWTAYFSIVVPLNV
jgi:hemolysin activation/secretion protein